MVNLDLCECLSKEVRFKLGIEIKRGRFRRLAGSKFH